MANQNSIPSNIPPSAVSAARDLWQQGKYMEAWDTLGQAGDRYADNAAGVLGRNQNAGDQFFQSLVRNYSPLRGQVLVR